MSHILDSLAKLDLERSNRGIGSALASISAEPICDLRPSIQLSDGTVELSGENNGSVGVDEIASRFARRKGTLLGFAAAGLVIGVLLTAISKPVYRARTAVQLESTDAYQNLSNGSVLSSPEAAETSDSYVQNEIKILQSESLAKRVAMRLGSMGQETPSPARTPLRKILNYLNPHRHPSSTEDVQIQAVQKAMTVRPSLKSQVVEIYFDSHSPELAAAGANAIVSEYLAINREAQLTSVHETTERLLGQISELKTKLDAENEELKAFASASGLLYSANQNALTEQRVGEIQEQLTKAEAERAAKQSRYEAALSNPSESLPNGAEDSLLKDYESSLATAERDLFQLRTVYTPEHYKVIDAESRVAQLKAFIEQERRNQIQRMRSEYDSAARTQHLIEGSYTNQTRKLETQSADAFRYTALKHELDSTQQLYDSLLRKSKEAGVASALHATSIRLIDAARPPETPYSPNLPLNIGIGLGSGTFLGVMTIVLANRRPFPMGVRDGTRALKIRELGAIPKASSAPYSRWRNTGAQPGLRANSATSLARWQTQPLLTESYHSALTSILFSPGFKHQHRILVVTSVEPQEGKTTITTNLGIALAETYGRVLLIDGDLRRPGLHKIFDECNDVGLTTVLAGDSSIDTLRLDTVTHSTPVPGLFILPSGPGSANVTALLHSVRMAQFLVQARREFDCVLIDTPPTSLFSDARLLGRLSDSVIMVFDANKANRSAMNTACLQFKDDGTNVLGAIQNRVIIGKQRDSYGYYQGYVAD